MNWIKRLSIFSVVTYSLALPFFVCSAENICPPKTKKDSFHPWIQGNKDFTKSFYTHAQHTGHNFVFSPISLQLGLAMTAEITLGETQKEIIEKAGLPEKANVRRFGARHILKHLNTKPSQEAGATTLNLANGAWLSSDIDFPLSNKLILNRFYQTNLQQVDFSSPEERRKEINTWVEENTQHQIQNLIPEGSIDPETKLVLVNTLYMRAPWKKAFDPELTYEAPFYGLEPKSTPAVSYMRQVGRFGYLKEANYTVVELPFKQTDADHEELSMFVILPHEPLALEHLEKEHVNLNRVNDWIKGIEPAPLDLSIPKFKIASSINAKEILQDMGMQLPFSEEAEFNLEGRVTISDIVHQAVFEIDENGGTGSAGTGIIIHPTSWQEPTEVVINHPFLFFVADKTTGMILFVGRVMLPNS